MEDIFITILRQIIYSRHERLKTRTEGDFIVVDLRFTEHSCEGDKTTRIVREDN